MRKKEDKERNEENGQSHHAVNYREKGQVSKTKKGSCMEGRSARRTDAQGCDQEEERFSVFLTARCEERRAVLFFSHAQESRQERKTITSLSVQMRQIFLERMRGLRTMGVHTIWERVGSSTCRVRENSWNSPRSRCTAKKAQSLRKCKARKKLGNEEKKVERTNTARDLCS